MDYDSSKLQKPSYVPKLRKKYTIVRKREKWTEDEHKRFLEAIEKFRRNWKKVEEYVKTKTRKQIRSHAQKHFKKLEKMGLNFPPPRAKRKASHPYPSRKTTELFSMYSKQFQTQPLQLQYQVLPSSIDKVNYDAINTFLGAMFIPNRFNMSDMLNKFNQEETLSIRVLLNNLAVSMQKDIQQELSYQQQQQSFYYQVYPQPQVFYEQPMMLHYDMNIHFDQDQQHYLQDMNQPFHNYEHVQLTQPHLTELHDINHHSNFFTDIQKH
eukprot:gene3158-5474_t